MLSKKLEDELVGLVASYLEEMDGEVYSEAVRKSIRHHVPDDKVARAYIKIAKSDNPERVVHLTIDNVYYKEIGYPMDRKKKSKKSKAKRKTKDCGCK